MLNDAKDDAGAAACHKEEYGLWESIREDAQFFMEQHGRSLRPLLWSQGFWSLVIYRFGNWNYRRRPFAIHRAFKLLHTVLLKMSEMAAGIYLPREATIGVPFYIAHFGGILVHNKAVIGKRCFIMQGVNVAINYSGAHEGAPVIGDDVRMCPGCKILGAIKIGNSVVIGANAVVTKSFPGNVLLVGVPAEVKKQLCPETVSEV